MKYAVTAQAFDRFTGAALARPRVEVIDTTANVLFAGADSIMLVRAAYEAFWNDLNPLSEEVVFVQRVRPVAVPSVVKRTALGQVIGDLMQAATDLSNDPMSDAVGFHPDPTPTLIRVAREQGWTFADIERELARRGVSERWQYNAGLGAIIYEEPADKPRDSYPQGALGECDEETT